MSAAGWADEVTRRWLRLAEEVQRRLGTGTSLPPAARERYARRLGFDVGGAALHQGAFAARLTGALGAAAVTAGGHVAGAEAALDPQTPAGAALLGHELTHVAQEVDPAAARGPALTLRPPVLAQRPRARPASPTAAPMTAPPFSAPTATASPAPGPSVQRAPTGAGDGEAAALSTELSILQASPQGGARRATPDPERLAELVYQRLVDAVREESSRSANAF
ncbi:MAG TPA: DUF4157 domain-containing protein [Chloroflexota bacterium]|nr:DUF4157 domain-containing protein [Chloroflexota bacterium]